MANGDIRSLGNMEDTVAATGCDGVMAARGMLENPAMYAGLKYTRILSMVLQSILNAFRLR